MITYPKDGEQNPEATSSKLPKEKKKKKKVLLITDDEDNSEAASSKQPQRKIQTRSVMREEKQFKKQEHIFTTYQRKPRKYKQTRSKSALGSQEEDPADEIGQDIQDTNEVIKQTKRINLFLDQQEKEKEKKSRQEIQKTHLLFSQSNKLWKRKRNKIQYKRMKNWGWTPILSSFQ